MMSPRTYKRRSFSTMPRTLPAWLAADSFGAGKTIALPVPTPKPPREKPVWRPMTDLERAACLALSPGLVSYLPGSVPKRIGRDLAAQATEAEPQITDKQAAMLWRQAWAYRRQISDGAVLREARRQHGEAKA
jgi:hypothetical protein